MPSLARPAHLVTSHQRPAETERSHLKFHDPHATWRWPTLWLPESGEDESSLARTHGGPAHRALLVRQIDLGDHLRFRFDNRVHPQMPRPVCRQDRLSTPRLERDGAGAANQLGERGKIHLAMKRLRQPP